MTALHEGNFRQLRSLFDAGAMVSDEFLDSLSVHLAVPLRDLIGESATGRIAALRVKMSRVLDAIDEDRVVLGVSAREKTTCDDDVAQCERALALAEEALKQAKLKREYVFHV